MRTLVPFALPVGVFLASCASAGNEYRWEASYGDQLCVARMEAYGFLSDETRFYISYARPEGHFENPYTELLNIHEGDAIFLLQAQLPFDRRDESIQAVELVLANRTIPLVAAPKKSDPVLRNFAIGGRLAEEAWNSFGEIPVPRVRVVLSDSRTEMETLDAEGYVIVRAMLDACVTQMSSNSKLQRTR